MRCPRSILIEGHRWAGVSARREGGFGLVVLGWVTVAMAPDRLSARLRDAVAAIRAALDRENAGRDGNPPEGS